MVKLRRVLSAGALVALASMLTATNGWAIGVSGGVPVGLPSTSPHAKGSAPASASVSAAIDPETITFDEFPLYTTITDDYKDHGVVFTSDVFTSVDSANPTAPVLTGSPQFFGDIVGRFTVPGTTTPTTVDGFSLDVGYIDNRDSVEIQYFDASGALAGSTRAQSYGINELDIAYRGVAGFKVTAVEYEAAGFAIDNLLIHRDAVGIQPLRMAELGDSYSSGEGLVPEKGLRYDCGTDLHSGLYFEGTTQPGSLFWEKGSCQTATGSEQRPRDLFSRHLVKYENLCHRHGRAYPNQIRERLGVQPLDSIFVACSGATTKNVGAGVGPVPQFPNSPPGVHGGKTQLDTVKDFAVGGTPELITIGIGGNDAGFGQIIKECIVSNCADPDFASRTISTINGTMFRNVRTTFENLKATFADPPLSHPATIVAFGYPSIIDDPGHWCKGFLTIDGSERTWLKDSVLPTVNDAIKDAAAEAGVVYVDITAATAGHGVCSPDEWINGVRLGDDSWYGKGNESFHPNQKAHDAIASYFIDHYTDGAGHLLVENPAPSPPIRPQSGPEINFGQIDGGAARKCGADCLQPAACVQTCKIHVQGVDFSPGVTMGAVLQSNPVSLGQITTDATGKIDTWFRLPGKLDEGLHSLTLDGLAADGTRQHAVQVFWVFGRVSSRIEAKFSASKRGTAVHALAVKHMSPGTRVDIACARGTKQIEKAFAVGHVKRSGGCPFAHRAFHAVKTKRHKARGKGHKANGRAQAKGSSAHRDAMRGAAHGKGGSYRANDGFAGYFKRPLAPGTVLRVVVTHHGLAGRTLDARIRAGRPPKLIPGCTEPGLRASIHC
jgi:lysophospholipase L1-like esterase